MLFESGEDEDCAEGIKAAKSELLPRLLQKSFIMKLNIFAGKFKLISLEREIVLNSSSETKKKLEEDNNRSKINLQVFTPIKA